MTFFFGLADTTQLTAAVTVVTGSVQVPHVLTGAEAAKADGLAGCGGSPDEVSFYYMKFSMSLRMDLVWLHIAF